MVNLSSSDMTEATVPASVVIAANKTSATYQVTAVDDAVLDDTVTVTITASAIALANATDTIDVTNDDVVPLAAGPPADAVVLTPGLLPGTYNAAAGPVATPSAGSPTYQTFGGQNVQTAGSILSFQSDNFFVVDASKTYALSGWARAGDEFGERFDTGNRQSFGFASYDVDMLPIMPENVLRFTGATDTTLAAVLKPGDTKILLTNGTGWSDAAGASAATRGLTWYGYHDSTGMVYADYSLTSCSTRIHWEPWW
jgi:hypothetical protein